MSSPSRRWVKVWHEILSDLDFQNLSLEQQARFYHLLVYTSSQGDNGKIEIDTPARFLVNLFQCPDYNHLKNCLIGLEKVGVLATFCNAKISVTFKYWSKYQVDTTCYERVQKFRNKQIVTPKVTPQDKDKDKEKKKKKTDKDIYGEFENVKLTAVEYTKLIELFKFQGTEQRIENLSSYIASKGDKYKSHYATLLQWEKKNGGHNGTGQQTPQRKQTSADKCAEILMGIGKGGDYEDGNYKDISGL